MKKLFGTDGIRGKAAEFPLDENTVRIIGASMATHYAEKLGRKARFVTGRDTRESGPIIQRAFHSGVICGGGDAVSAGVITTPGVAYLTKTHGFDAGIVISASHNPFTDNGLKIFTPSGKKADESIEKAIESDVAAGIDLTVEDDEVDHSREAEFQRDYLDYLHNEFADLNLSGKHIVVDCANGAASSLAPGVFRRFGAVVTSIHDTPDGRNINKDCGSMHLEHLQQAVMNAGADFGVAFDGDADRSLFVDERGTLVDGDATLWIMSRFLSDHGKLPSGKIVATVMSNIGLEIALREKGIELIRTAVGDKYVLEELLKNKLEIGGEQSGHVIFPETSLVGDGMMTALHVLEAMAEKQTTFSAMLEGFEQFPQVLINVRVKEKPDFLSVPAIASHAAAVETELEGKGRLLLRYSGTENLARVMIEGPEQGYIDTLASRLAETIRATIG